MTRFDAADQGDDVIKILKGNEGWHADSTCMPVQAKGAVFSAVTVPASAATPDEPRLMWHSRLAGDPVSEAALPVEALADAR